MGHPKSFLWLQLWQPWTSTAGWYPEQPQQVMALSPCPPGDGFLSSSGVPRERARSSHLCGESFMQSQNQEPRPPALRSQHVSSPPLSDSKLLKDQLKNLQKLFQYLNCFIKEFSFKSFP